MNQVNVDCKQVLRKVNFTIKEANVIRDRKGISSKMAWMNLGWVVDYRPTAMQSSANWQGPASTHYLVKTKKPKLYGKTNQQGATISSTVWQN